MMFEDWMTKMRATRKVPFGTAYELFAREAWNAAISEEREACATVCADLKAKAETAAKVHCGLNSVAFAEAYQHAEGAIRMRSNV